MSLKILCLIVLIVSCFAMGLFTASQFRFHEIIEPYRWAVMSLILLVNLSYILAKLHKAPND